MMVFKFNNLFLFVKMKIIEPEISFEVLIVFFFLERKDFVLRLFEVRGGYCITIVVC